MWKLVIEDDEGKRTSVPLTRDDYTIGRKEGNTIRLTERNVSRDHAKIHKANGAPIMSPDSPFLLEDMNSYNGVYVNGLRVAQPQKLQHGDLIQIGDYRIVLQDEQLTDAESTAGVTTQDMKSTVPTGVVNRSSMLLERPNRFVMLAGPTPGAEYPLQERTTIGRAEDCTISVNHNSVSRLHCEIHVLGDPRYEIVDKGSSNGVRVNGSDLRRSIIEPGDIVELGDVRFRFVGAGQIFLPGVGDSQQLEAIPDRPPTSIRSTAKPSSTSLLPFVIVGAVIAIGVVGVFAWMQKNNQTTGPTPSATVTSDDPEQVALAAAKQLCDEGKCDLAHDKLMLSIDAKSSLRQGTDFQNIETRWADSVLGRAEKESDPKKKRALLHSVADADSVPQSRRSIATSKLAELDAVINVPPTASTAPTATHTATAPPPTVTNTGTATSTATAPTTTTTHRPTGGANVFNQASQLSMSGDNAGARALLEPRVFGSGKATPEEVRLLKGICRAQHDKNCTTAIEQKYP